MPQLKPPRSGPGRFLFFAVLQFIAYFVFVANTRAFTRGLYGWTAATDGWLAMQGFLMPRLIVKDEGGGAWAICGTIFGGVCGSLLSIFVTRHLYGN
jgi:hypothetical protein